ncbi:MAG: branched-chain amino acid ABC transporter permease [Actinobacteria bacterium]|nr:branched-chain amino acid ABC transporter permease [Actinomycetota bacterium]
MGEFFSDIVVNVILTTPLIGAYTMFALGITFIYRASKVLNLAHGAMAMFPAYIAYQLTGSIGVVLAFVGALLFGGALGLAVERTVVRRLRQASPTAQTVGTAGVLGMLIAVAVRFWGTSPRRAPSIFPDGKFSVGNSLVTYTDLGLFFSALGLAVLFLAIFKYTDLGLAMRCAADNRRAAWLMGIDPDRTTAAAWIFAGMLAAFGGVLLAASTILHPYVLALQVLPAFVAALIGGLESETGAVGGSFIVGLTIGIVPLFGGIGEEVGAPQVALGLLAFVVMSVRGRRFSVAEASASTAL